MTPYRSELADHLPASDLAAVREILREINSRIARFDDFRPSSPSTTEAST